MEHKHDPATSNKMRLDTQAVYNVWLNATICWVCPHFGGHEQAQYTL